MFRDPTPKQKKILSFIKVHREEYGYSPTYTEIGNVMGKALGTIQHHIIALAKKGLIKHYPHRARGIVPININ